jgi:chromosome segregation ATPase
MLLLNIFQHFDGSFAWDNMAILLLALVAGYLLRQYGAKKTLNSKYTSIVASWESKHKTLENEFKGYKATIASSDKANHKLATDSAGRVKALEGDIRVLSDEKNKYHHQLEAKQEELRQVASQRSELEDQVKELREEKIKSEADWSSKLKITKEQLTKAAAWEQRVKSAEEEAHKARAATSQAERKKLEAELRLRATTEFAGKVTPLEKDLEEAKLKYVQLLEINQTKSSTIEELEAKLLEVQSGAHSFAEESRALIAELEGKQNHIATLEERINSLSDLSSKINVLSSQLELQLANNQTLRLELETKQAAQLSSREEMEFFKSNLKKLSEENEFLKKSLSTAVEGTGLGKKKNLPLTQAENRDPKG